MTTNDDIEISVDNDIVQVDERIKRYLEVLPEEYHAKIEALYDPSIEELKADIEKLPSKEKEGFKKWLQKNNTDKIGYHVSQSTFSIPDLRIDQGTGNDLAKPANSMKGCTYDSDGNLVTGAGQSAMLLKIPERFRGAVISVQNTRQMWPPRDSNNNVIPMTGIDNAGNGPLCSSMDRLRGTRWGDCSKCDYRPFANGPKNNRNNCKDDVRLYVVRLDDTPNGPLPFSSIYRIILSSTSVLSGAKPITQRVNGWDYLWSKLFLFEAIPQTRDNKTWYQWKTSLAISSDEPGGVTTSKETSEVLKKLAQKISATIYFPLLANIYDKKNNLESGTEKVSTGDSMLQALNAGSDPGANI